MENWLNWIPFGIAVFAIILLINSYRGNITLYNQKQKKKEIIKSLRDQIKDNNTLILELEDKIREKDKNIDTQSLTIKSYQEDHDRIREILDGEYSVENSYAVKEDTEKTYSNEKTYYPLPEFDYNQRLVSGVSVEFKLLDDSKSV